MYDGVRASLVPPDGGAYAGYIDGNYQSYNQMVALYPGVYHIPITVLGANLDARVADIELGDLTPYTGARWAKLKLQYRKGRPTLYCSTSLYDPVASALKGFGLAFGTDVDWWEAHYDGVARLSNRPGAVAKQYHNTPGYDVSIADIYWARRDKGGVAVQPQHQPPWVMLPWVADCAWPGGGALGLADDGSVYAVGGAPYWGGPNTNQEGENWQAGRHGATIGPHSDGLGYIIFDTAGEDYNYRKPGA